MPLSSSSPSLPKSKPAMNRRAVLFWFGALLAGALCVAGIAGLVAAAPSPGSLLAAALGWVGMTWQTTASAMAIITGLVLLLTVRLRGENVRLEALIDERTRALQASETKFRGIFEHAVEGIFLSSPAGRNLAANPAMVRLCGYDSAEDLRRSLTDLDSQFYAQPGRRQEVNALLEAADVLEGCESEIRRKDGTTLWVSENVRVVKDPDTGERLYLGSIADISEKRRAEVQLRAAMHVAEAASRAKSAFLTNMSHELRTPLNAILGFARVLVRDLSGPDHTRHRERLAVIESSGEHLLHLINEVLDLSKIEAGKTELQPGPFHLPGLLMELTDVFRPRAAEKGVTLQLTATAATLPQMVRADGPKLRQVLFNLLGNAVKFTDRGRVELRASRAAGAGSRVFFEVEDTGAGIAPEQQETIFLPFHQATDPTRAAQGTGLGLSISARLVELMGGGALQVVSAPGVGSRFFFDLDLPEAAGTGGGAGAPATKPGRPLPAGYRGARRHILVVDDEAANRAVLEAVLAPLGFQVSEAASGADCLRRCDALAPDLVLLDLLMPAPDGFETARRLRAETARGPALKILAFSASAFSQTRADALAAGCDDFLSKPLDEGALCDTLGRLLGLEWTHSAAEPGASSERPLLATTISNPPASLPLPDAELAALQALALAGDVVKIRARLRTLAQTCDDPLLGELETLAAGFQLERLTQTLAHARHEPEAAASLQP